MHQLKPEPGAAKTELALVNDEGCGLRRDSPGTGLGCGHWPAVFEQKLDVRYLQHKVGRAGAPATCGSQQNPTLAGSGPGVNLDRGLAAEPIDPVQSRARLSVSDRTGPTLREEPGQRGGELAGAKAACQLGDQLGPGGIGVKTDPLPGGEKEQLATAQSFEQASGRLQYVSHSATQPTRLVSSVKSDVAPFDGPRKPEVRSTNEER